MPTNILNLPEFKVFNVEESCHDYRIDAQASFEPDTCPNCKHPELVKFGRRTEVVMDTPIHGKRVGILVNRRRYRCQSCARTFYEDIPGKDSKRLATTRLVQYIERKSMEQTFAYVADEVGLDEKTIRNIFSDYADRLDRSNTFETPRYLGIDEIHVISRPRCVLTNIYEQTLLDLLPNRNKPTVVKFLSNMKHKERVQFVAMDMWAPYKQAVNICLPKATIVIDKFHVVRMANIGMENARKSVRSNLTAKQRRGLMRDRFILLRRKHEFSMPDQISFDTWTKNFPEIGEAYELKEAFYYIWDNALSREQAEQAYNTWESCLSPQMRVHFGALVTAVNNWRDDIFAYFDHPITNSYTESLNSLIRVMNRVARGYSFNVLRAKMLYTNGTRKKKKPSYSRSWGYAGPGMMIPEKNLGVSISTLIQKLESNKSKA